MNIADWLEHLGLGQYAAAFEANAIDAETLRTLTADDLKEIGVAALGHRKKILEAIASLGAGRAAGGTDSAPEQGVVDPTSQHLAYGSRPREAERRQLTVMFVDLVGSTGLSRSLDPEEMRDLLRQFQNAAAGEIARFEGHLAKLMGDGLLAYFGWPKAHEDEAERAVRAGLAVAQVIEGIATKSGQPLSARVGIATGLVVVGDLIGTGSAQENAVVGETPNLAARLQALAKPGTVVISELTHRLVGEIFEARSIGSQAVPGFDRPIEAYRVVGEGQIEGRFEALHAGATVPLAGRDLDVALLMDRWRLAAGGEGQVVELVGEPGIGKSRLLQELRDRLKDEPHLRLRYFCSPYHAQSALHPVATQFLRAADIKRSDPPERQLELLRQRLARSTRDPELSVPLLAAMLSIPVGERYPPLELTPHKQKSLTFDVLLEQLEELAREAPVLMLIEDAHHLDPTSAELFDIVVDRVRKLPILLVAASRPDGPIRWNGLPHATLLTLGRLSRAQAGSIIEAVTGGRPLPPIIVEQVLAKTEGIPLFIEELTKVVLESGLLTENNGALTLSGPLPPLAVPATLHDSLMARLDRLASVREVAQIGAVIGREFAHDLLAAASRLPEPELERATAQLVDAGLVFRRITGEQVGYAFKHALVQDAAYNSLLMTRRQQLHGRIAQLLEARHPEVVAAEPEVLAHHFGQAGLVAKAVEYNELAGRHAVARSALSEAQVRFENALSGVERLPPQEQARRELPIQIALGNVHAAAHGFASASAGTAYARARSLCEELEETRTLFPVLYGLCLYHLYAAELVEARAAADRLLELAEAGNDRGLSFFAHRAVGVAALPAGDLAAARAHLEEALRLFDPGQHRAPAFIYAFDPRVVCLDYLARTLLLLGEVNEALALSDEAIAEARTVGNGNSLAVPLFFGGVIHQVLGHVEKVAGYSAELTRIASDAGFRFWLAGASILAAWVAAVRGDLDGGRAGLRKGIDEWRSTGARYLLPYFAALEAEVDARSGAAESAVRRLEAAHLAVEQTNERWYAAELLRLRAELLAGSGPERQALAREGFLDACGTAEAQGARLWELRARLGLARLEADGGQARDELAQVLASLPAATDLPEFAAARALACMDARA